MIDYEVLTEPQPGPQYALTASPCFENFFGGARGGGKTYACILDYSLFAGNHPGTKGVIFRKTYNELEEVKTTADRILLPLGAIYRASLRMYVMPNGCTLKLRHLDREDDANKYQGHQYQWMAFDEVTNWANPSVIDRVKATVRDAEHLRIVYTGNPGGPGHNWVKARFVDPAPQGNVRIYSNKTKSTRIFIPSKISDNKALLDQDPDYPDRLKGSGPEWLVKAWLDGDWNIVAGGMFDDVWSMKYNMVEPFQIPKSWRVDRSFDWGSSAPFSVGWWAEADGTEATMENGDKWCPARGSIIRFSEWYGWDGKPNTGLRMLAKDIAAGIKEREEFLSEKYLGGRKISPGPADSSIFNAENGVCIADDMKAAPNRIRWQAADKRPGSRVTGWDRMRAMMKAAHTWPMEDPGLFVFNTCTQFIRTVPLLPRDDKKIDDVDTTAEDHVGDEARYRVQQVKRIVRSTKVEGL